MTSQSRLPRLGGAPIGSEEQRYPSVPDASQPGFLYFPI